MTHRGPFQPPPFCDSVILYVPHRSLSTCTGARGMQGAGTDPAVYASVCLTPSKYPNRSKYPVLLTSASVLPTGRSACASSRKGFAVPVPWCFFWAERERWTHGLLPRACHVPGILQASACCALCFFLVGVHLLSYGKNWRVPEDSCQAGVHLCYWGWR